MGAFKSVMNDDRKTPDYEKFFLRIAAGIDPTSGEQLPENSIWRDAEITDAVRKVLAISEPTSIEPSAVKSLVGGPGTQPLEQFLLELTDDQKCIWNAIEGSESGIAFQELCEKTRLSHAKVQGDLGAITVKSRRMFGEDHILLNKKNDRYYPRVSRPAEQSTSSKATSYHERFAKTKEQSPNAYASWDDDQEMELRELFDRQTSIAVIARVMGRQPGGIRSRLNKLGLIEQDDAKQIAQDVSPEVVPNLEDNVIEIEEVFDTAIGCDECGEVIPELRLKAIPGTSKCVDCASKQPFDKIQIKEPWGTREEFKRDRQSWMPGRGK